MGINGLDFSFLGCCMDGRNILHFRVGDRSWLDFKGSDLTWFLSRVKNNLVFVFGSKLTWFMWVSKFDLISV